MKNPIGIRFAHGFPDFATLHPGYIDGIRLIIVAWMQRSEIREAMSKANSTCFLSKTAMNLRF
jgi:hypothetical protein